MFANFENAFFKKKEMDIKVPKEIIESLSEQLPEGFEYTDIGNGAIGISSKSKEGEMKLQGLKPLLEEFPNNFKPSSMKELTEFMYRSQRPVKLTTIDEDFVSIAGQPFKLTELVAFPFSDNKVTEANFIMSPPPLPDPYKIKIEGYGVKRNIEIQRQPYDEMDKLLFKSINNPAFIITYIIDETSQRLQFSFKLNLDSAKNVKDVVEVLKLYKSCLDGSFKIFDVQMPKPSDMDMDMDMENKSINAIIDFWEKALILQNILKVQFFPESQTDKEDVILIEELYRSLYEKKPFKEYININELTLYGVKDLDSDTLLYNEDLTFQFSNHSKVELLGAEFEIFSIKGFFDFKVIDTEYLKNNQSNMRLIVKPKEDKKIFQSIVHFINQEEATQYRENIDISILQNADELNFNIK